MAKFKTELTPVRAENKKGQRIGDAEFEVSVQCLACKHLFDIALTCKAFPKGIPQEIIMGDHDHTEPFDGDNGIHFQKL